ncbi:MAG: hypothetical protein M1837_001035 [Sclerophora amabilis]|nr:MAG: hypothetical protein M1837_001035 [Sclerophora amabilis]
MSLNRIDVHHHFVPSFYAEALREAGGDPSGWPIPHWSIKDDLKFMNSQEIGTSILSMTAPGPTICNGLDSVKLARRTNDFAASIRDENPSRYGFFAALPSILDEKQAALDEIVYALDTLKADGVTLFTRYGSDNHYLGHDDFREIWDLLDSRGAVVFIHPTHAVDTHLVNPKLPQPVIDYPHETTRTAVDLIISNTVRSHPNCKIILPHAGGTLPFLAMRPAVLLPYTGLGVEKSTSEFIEDAQSFYFDLALSGNEHTLDALLRFAKRDHVVFGSDYPYAPGPSIKEFTQDFDAYSTGSRNKHDKMGSLCNRENALKLFPRITSL